MDIKDLFYKGYYGTIEYSLKDKVFHGKVIGIRGLLSYEGNTLPELEDDFMSAINEYLYVCKEQGVKPEKTHIIKDT